MICSKETFDGLRAFSDATGMAIAFQPAEGQSVCGAAGQGIGVFCRMVSEKLGGQAPCRAALGRSIQAAANSRKPESIQCFAGLRHTVVPVFNSRKTAVCTMPRSVWVTASPTRAGFSIRRPGVHSPNTSLPSASNTPVDCSPKTIRTCSISPLRPALAPSLSSTARSKKKPASPPPLGD